MEIRDLVVDSLAAGGDGVARDDGRVTFVPRTAPGDAVRARIVKATASYARAELVAITTPSPDRVEPPCPAFVQGCGGCAWQHVSREAQLRAKRDIVANAMRKTTAVVQPTLGPAPALGWRRRARFHVTQGRVGLYREASHDVLAIASCPQLEPALDAALAVIRDAAPPDGELALLLGHRGDIVVAVTRPWRNAASLVGRANIVGVIAGEHVSGNALVEVEPGLWGGPNDFAQASAAGNATLRELVHAMVRESSSRIARGRLVELYAGAGNFTRQFVADGWRVSATDGVQPARPIEDAEFRAGNVAEFLADEASRESTVDVVVLDPPRAGAADAIDGIVQLAPRTIVYVSCDPATLARDVVRLEQAGYRVTDAVPVDLMPQTAHVEVVVRLVHEGERAARSGEPR